MKVVINGEDRTLEDALSVLDLLETLGLSARATIVEHNGTVLHKAALGETNVQEGDRLELIRLVGGG
jgi:sulfur carrier protein